MNNQNEPADIHEKSFSERELIYFDREEEHIATVTINNPEKLNVMTRKMWGMLDETIRTLSADDSLRCIIIRGAGTEAFSPGCDINEFATVRSNREQGIEYGHFLHGALSALRECRHPIVAEIHGMCIGSGLEVAALCDLRICGNSSTFGAPIKNLGLVMAYPELEPIVRLAGKNIALEILLEGRIFEAEEAFQKGLVTRVVADELVADETLSTARRIASGAPLSARWHKKFINRLADPAPISESEQKECFDCFDTEDFRTGCAAFLLHHRPNFQGK